MYKINVLVAGSTGYIGIELVKILINHKYVNIKYLCGNTSAGKSLSNYDKDLKNKQLPKIIKFNKNLLSNVDVILLHYQMVRHKKYLIYCCQKII